MGTVLGVLVDFVLIGGFVAFIGLVSKDNGQGRQEYRGYQPNKPLDGPPPNKGNCIQKLPDDKRCCAAFSGKAVHKYDL